MRRSFWLILTGCLVVTAPFQAAGATSDLAACLSAPTNDCLIASATDRLAQMPESGDRASLLAALGVEQVRAGLDDAASASFARAVQEAQAGPEPTQRVDSLMAIARLQAEAGRMDDSMRSLQAAARMAQAAADDGPADLWSNRLRTVADRQADFGDRAGAADTLAAAVAAATAISDPFQRSAELILTASRQAALIADPATALSTYRTAAAAAAQISDGEIRAAMLLSVGQSQLEAGLADPGLQALREALAAVEALPPAAGRNRLEATIALVLLKNSSQ